jgi:hypothetical protein
VAGASGDLLRYLRGMGCCQKCQLPVCVRDEREIDDRMYRVEASQASGESTLARATARDRVSGLITGTTRASALAVNDGPVAGLGVSRPRPDHRSASRRSRVDGTRPKMTTPLMDKHRADHHRHNSRSKVVPTATASCPHPAATKPAYDHVMQYAAATRCKAIGHGVRSPLC